MWIHIFLRQHFCFALAVVGLLTINHSFSDSWDPGDDTSGGATQLLEPTIAIQTHGTHFLDASDASDWFKISLDAGITYLFEATGISDTEGYLYHNPGGVPVASNSDDGEEGFNFLIVYTPIVSGDYYLKVEEWNSGAADYVLKYKVALDGWDSADDTGATASLRIIEEFEYTEGSHSLTETDTNDWYCFTLTAGNTYRFESTGIWNTYARLFSDVAGTAEVANDDDSGAGLNFTIDYTPVTSGNYYLQVSQISEMENNEAYARYDFRYRLIEDEWDPIDNSGAGATMLSLIDETIRKHGSHALSSSDSYDWFQVSLLAGQTYRFEATGASDTEAYLYANAAGTEEVAYNDDESINVSFFRIIYTPTISGNYYLRVNHSFVGDDAIYQLKYGIENDMDGDGMYDAWEITYLGGTNAQPGAHGDSDPHTNLEEFIAGTDPTNSASYFAVTNGSTGSFIVGWPSVESREYRVYWAESLTNSFQQIGPVIDYPQNSYTDTAHNAESSGFYKVDVQLAP